MQTLDIFDRISTSPPNRLPKIDLSFVRDNMVKCGSFLRENNLLGKTTRSSYTSGMTRIMHTLDTLNSYIDGFSNSTDEPIKDVLQNQVFGLSYTLHQNLEKVEPFLDKLIKEIDAYLQQIKTDQYN